MAAVERRGRWILRTLIVAGLAFLAPDRVRGQVVEDFQIGLSTETIAITSNFNGARLVVFGALDNADSRILRQQRYDIVVALEGPRRPIVVRKKERTAGLWINRGSETFLTPPFSYALASTRPLGDVTSQRLLKQVSIGIDDLRLGGIPAVGSAADDDLDEYAEAFRRIKRESGLYNQVYGSVEFVSRTLFRAELRLPADLPVGRHVARAFLFRNGEFLLERSQSLVVVKTGLENFVYEFANRYAVLYGLFAVVLAIFTGWFGRIAFKRD